MEVFGPTWHKKFVVPTSCVRSPVPDVVAVRQSRDSSLTPCPVSDRVSRGRAGVGAGLGSAAAAADAALWSESAGGRFPRGTGHPAAQPGHHPVGGAGPRETRQTLREVRRPPRPSPDTAAAPVLISRDLTVCHAVGLSGRRFCASAVPASVWPA